MRIKSGKVSREGMRVGDCKGEGEGPGGKISCVAVRSGFADSNVGGVEEMGGVDEIGGEGG